MRWQAGGLSNSGLMQRAGNAVFKLMNRWYTCIYIKRAFRSKADAQLPLKRRMGAWEDPLLSPPQSHATRQAKQHAKPLHAVARYATQACDATAVSMLLPAAVATALWPADAASSPAPSSLSPSLPSRESLGSMSGGMSNTSLLCSG